MKLKKPYRSGYLSRKNRAHACRKARRNGSMRGDWVRRFDKNEFDLPNGIDKKYRGEG